MLHDPGHYEPPLIAWEIKRNGKDNDILRRLTSEVAEIAQRPMVGPHATLIQLGK